MAAVIELHTGRALEPASVDDGRSGVPRLHVIQGGRSAHALHMRRVFLRRRLLALGVVVLLCAAIAQAVRMGAVVVAGSSSTAVHAEMTYVVEEGDTLWELARMVDPSADPRDVVERITDLNSDGSAVDASGLLRAGETVRLPVAG